MLRSYDRVSGGRGARREKKSGVEKNMGLEIPTELIAGMFACGCVCWLVAVFLTPFLRRWHEERKQKKGANKR